MKYIYISRIKIINKLIWSSDISTLFPTIQIRNWPLLIQPLDWIHNLVSYLMSGWIEQEKSEEIGWSKNFKEYVLYQNEDIKYVQWIWHIEKNGKRVTLSRHLGESCCNNNDRGRVLVRYSRFLTWAIVRVIEPVRWMLAVGWDLSPSSKTWRCKPLFCSAPVSPTDILHEPSALPSKPMKKMYRYVFVIHTTSTNSLTCSLINSVK